MMATSSSRNLLALCLCIILQLHHAADYCTGQAGRDDGCNQQVLKNDCTGFTGCEWNKIMAKCQGFPTICTDMVTCELCNNHGACSWYDIGKSSQQSVCTTAAPETVEYNDDVTTGDVPVDAASGGGTYGRQPTGGTSTAGADQSNSAAGADQSSSGYGTGNNSAGSIRNTVLLAKALSFISILAVMSI